MEGGGCEDEVDPDEEEGRPAEETVRPFELVVHFHADCGIGHDKNKSEAGEDEVGEYYHCIADVVGVSGSGSEVATTCFDCEDEPPD